MFGLGEFKRWQRHCLVWGVLLGSSIALLVFAPAAWLAQAANAASAQRVLLTDAQGTVWRGSAVLVLSGGQGSQAALALPGRLSWRLSWLGAAFELRAQQPCCLNDNFRLLIEPGFGRVKLSVAAAPTALGQWPAAWLAGLGAPWNTLQLGGTLRLHSTGLSLDSAQGRHAFAGGAKLVLEDLSSQMSALPRLGHYTLGIDGQASAGNSAALSLSTQQGPLLLSGQGQFGGATGGSANVLRFRGEARAAPEAEAALNNLLNVIGRRQGAMSILSIG